MAVSLATPLLVDVIDLLGSKRADQPNIDITTWQTLKDAHRGLTEALAADRRASALLDRFVATGHELTREEVRRCVEYISSHLVNKYQGILAEFLAARELGIWLSEQVMREAMGADVFLASGDAIRERRHGAAGGPWLRGADALLLLNRDDSAGLLIAGIIEVKSFATTYAQVAPQIEAHILRLQGGLRFNENYYPPERLSPAWWRKRGGWQVGATPKDWQRVLRILVTTKRKRALSRGHKKVPPACRTIALPVAKSTLGAMAYALTVRFLEGIGERVFKAGSPWPEMSAGEAAVNAVKEALYHILLEDRAGSAHATGIVKRLYNVYGFGYANAEGHREMLWPGKDGEPTSDQGPTILPSEPAGLGVKELVDGAWRHYRRGAVRDSRRWAEAALARDREEATRLRAPWLLGMTHFYLAEFERACMHLPDPGPRPAEGHSRWAKDMLTLARAWVRVGHLERARALVETVEGENLQWVDLKIALPVMKGWLSLRAGFEEQAQHWLQRGYDSLATLRTEQHERDMEGYGTPQWWSVGAIQTAVIDAATLMSALGHRAEALELLRPLSGLFAPVREFVAVDPALELLRIDPATRDGFEEWLCVSRSE